MHNVSRLHAIGTKILAFATRYHELSFGFEILYDEIGIYGQKKTVSPVLAIIVMGTFLSQFKTTLRQSLEISGTSPPHLSHNHVPAHI
jgi:hypothetical protein